MDSFVQLSKVLEIVGEIFELGSLPMTGRVKIQYVTKEKREIRSQEDLEEAIIYYEEKKLAFLNLFCTIQSPTVKPQDQQQQQQLKTNVMPARHTQQPFVDPPTMQQASKEDRQTLATMPLKTRALPETRQMPLKTDKDRNNTNGAASGGSSEQKTRKFVVKKISPNIAPNTNLEPIDESGGARSFEYSENSSSISHHQTNQTTGYLSNHVFGYNPNMTHRMNNHYSNPMQPNYHPPQPSLQSYNYNNRNHHQSGGRSNEIEKFHQIMPHEPAPLLVARPTHPFNYFSSDGDFVVTHQQPRTFNLRAASEALMTTAGSSLTASTIRSSRNSYLDLFEKRMQVMEAARQKIQQKVLDRHLKYQ